jgi:hypothetical protein
MDDIMKLKEMLDVDTFAPVAKQLQQKAWLMHWSLFVFFNHENGLNALIDLFLQDRCGAGGPCNVHMRDALWLGTCCLTRCTLLGPRPVPARHGLGCILAPPPTLLAAPISGTTSPPSLYLHHTHPYTSPAGTWLPSS